MSQHQTQKKRGRAGTHLFKPTIVGALIKNVREAQGLSQGDLATAANVAKQAISNLERGSVVPSIRTIEAVCGPLKLDPVDVIRAGFGNAPGEVTALQRQIASLLAELDTPKLELAISQLKVLHAWTPEKA